MQMKRALFLLLILVAASGNVSCQSQQQSKSEKKDLKTTKEKVSYTIGADIGQNFKTNEISVDFDALMMGLKHAMNGDTLLLDEKQRQEVMMEFQKTMQDERDKKQKQAGSENLKKSNEFLEQNKKKAGVVTLPSGLQYEIIKEGKGPKPTKDNQVEVHYHGTLPDGKVFDSSVDRGQTITFPVTGVIPGWTEALQLMPVGSKWKLYIPPSLAYGEQGAGGVIGPNQALIFEVELIAVK